MMICGLRLVLSGWRSRLRQAKRTSARPMTPSGDRRNGQTCQIKAASLSRPVAVLVSFSGQASPMPHRSLQAGGEK